MMHFTFMVAMSESVLTSRNLAEMIGVSQSAVSRAFTPGASISPQLRARVLAAAERLGYSPHPVGRSLSGLQRDVVGLVISDLRNPFYSALLERLTQALQQAGLQTLLFNVTQGADVKQQLAALRLFNVTLVIVISATVLSAKDLLWAAEGRRMILVNRVAAETDLPSITCDSIAGTRAVADHFHELGVRKVAYVGGLAHTVIARERRDAFITRIAEHGMTLTDALSAGEYSYMAGWTAAQELSLSSRPEAVFFANDILAVGGMDALRDQCGLSVPRDVAVAGFDDIAMSSWPRYQLTTVRQPIATIVDATMARAKQVRLPDGGSNDLRLPGTLVVRASTCANKATTKAGAPP
jgi:DNA-binding LacI/PurR family transcriptional regulator